MGIDLNELFDQLDGRIEDRTFDLKCKPPPVNDVVKEIQAGMNGLEDRYRVIIGIDEGPNKRFDRANITPVTWPAGKGALADADTYRTAIDATLKATTSDYHEGHWSFHNLPVPGGHILIVEAMRSRYGPHQNTQGGRYYIRRAGSTSHMTAAEIREAMGGRGGDRPDPDAPRPPIPDGEFLVDLRNHHWVRDANELRYAGGPQIHVRVLPVNSNERRYSGTLLKNSVKDFHSLGPWQSGSNERVEDGYLAWRVERANPEKTGAFSKIFETGEIWGVDNALLAPGGGGSANIPAIVVQEVRKALLQYARVLETCLRIMPPYRVQVTLHGVKNAWLHTTSRGKDGRCLKEIIHFHTIWERKKDPNADDLCNEFARLLLDACGLVLTHRINFQDP